MGVHVPAWRYRHLDRGVPGVGGERRRDHVIGAVRLEREHDERGREAHDERSAHRPGPQRSGSTRAGRGSPPGRGADSAPADSGTHSTISRP